MKLFSKIAYHSTMQKGLTKFRDTTDDEVAYTGEGAQIHGWGLYLQADKELNLERYKENLSQPYIEMDFGNGMHDWYWYHEEKKSLGFYESDMPLRMTYVAVEHLWDRIPDDFAKWSDEQLNSEIRNIINNDDELETLKDKFKVAHINKPSYSQYEIEFPDDFVFLEEDGYIRDMPDPDKMIRLFYDIRKQYGWNDIDWNDSWLDILTEQFQDDYNFDGYEYENELASLFAWVEKALMEYVPMTKIYSRVYHKAYEISNNVADIADEIINDLCDWFGIFDGDVENMKGYDYYMDLSKHYSTAFNQNMPHQDVISDILYKNGIDGIHYSGGLDGECWVIFNCSQLKILSEKE